MLATVKTMGVFFAITFLVWVILIPSIYFIEEKKLIKEELKEIN